MNELRKKTRRLNDALYTLDRIYKESERKKGIKDSEMCLMYALDDDKSHSQKQICDDRQIPRTTLNTIIKQWERNAYLELKPIPGKRRDMEIVLTDEGKEYAKPFLDFLYRAEEQAMEKTLQHYSEEFIEAIEYFYAALLEAFETQNDFTEKRDK